MTRYCLVILRLLSTNLMSSFRIFYGFAPSRGGSRRRQVAITSIGKAGSAQGSNGLAYALSHLFSPAGVAFVLFTFLSQLTTGHWRAGVAGVVWYGVIPAAVMLYLKRSGRLLELYDPEPGQRRWIPAGRSGLVCYRVCGPQPDGGSRCHPLVRRFVLRWRPAGDDHQRLLEDQHSLSRRRWWIARSDGGGGLGPVARWRCRGSGSLGASETGSTFSGASGGRPGAWDRPVMGLAGSLRVVVCASLARLE